ncbi:syntaxin-8 [Stomoxys calcitrans]|uniref:syntaxin-8 n=1 Tax=Stomoxys calcitrans TaxID=35570 RepID=UPI0027E3972B|nr:syntaxin-8 [Stomoxys calcitrans]
MALVDVDSWLTEYESCSRLNQTLLTQLNERDGKQTSSVDYNRLTSSIQLGIRQFDRELQELKYKLSEAAKTKAVTFEEIERRQTLWDSLQSQRQLLKKRYLSATRSDRSALLETSAASSIWSSPNRAGPSADSGNESDTAAIIDVQRLKQTQIDMLEQQNRGLETLSQTISRQRALATQIGQEFEEQNDILDNLANTAERVERGVSRETQGITAINRNESSTWGYWIVIIVLFIAIIIVGVL